ncbi:hypothetical protein DS832_04790 [Bombilactobacillus bombi]|uniref:Phage head morphogenesis domain-containing protein n=1 Tax=Bombilactobacillus bombi TaxID=1303590 RepID=A0A3R6W6D0_9LACO|nr:minor capsid protein [Bombilactobacillus bombi]RHW46808.1 hypothetical protein DS832_04790 [Bombilactobacillus bombi]
MTKNDYWEQREKAWINSNIRKDQDFDKQLESYYNQALKDITNQINQFYLHYAKAEGITLSEAMKRVSEADINKLSKEASQMVPKKDFSKYANQEMKLYNATMRINRLEMIKSQIGQILVEHGSNIENTMQDNLTKTYLNEIKRQAGIFGDYTNPTEKLKSDAKTIVDSSFQNATWSERLWNSMSALQATIGIDLSQAMTQGLNANKLQKDLLPLIKNDVKNAKYVSQRLARTEFARVADQAQMASFRKYHVKYVKWIAEPSACAICLDIASHDEGIYKIEDAPDIPVHPNCRCSKAGDAREEFEDYIKDKPSRDFKRLVKTNPILKNDPNGLRYNELAALKKYISFEAYLLNEDLRLGNKLTPEQNTIVKNLDKALDKLPTFNNTLYRSYTKFRNKEELDEFLNNFYVGKVFKSPAYLSTSKDIYDPKDDARIVILKSHSGKDLKDYNNSETEVLFKRNSTFRVIGIENKKHPTIIVEEVK